MLSILVKCFDPRESIGRYLNIIPVFTYEEDETKQVSK